MKSNLEDLCLNISKCILILLKNDTIWSHNLVLLLVKKELYLVKSRLWASINRKVLAAVPNFARDFSFALHCTAWGRARMRAVYRFCVKLSSVHSTQYQFSGFFVHFRFLPVIFLFKNCETLCIFAFFCEIATFNSKCRAVGRSKNLGVPVVIRCA